MKDTRLPIPAGRIGTRYLVSPPHPSALVSITLIAYSNYISFTSSPNQNFCCCTDNSSDILPGLYSQSIILGK